MPSASECQKGRGGVPGKAADGGAQAHIVGRLFREALRRRCIQGVCIRRVPPSRSMDIDRVTRLARHTGFGQPALLRLYGGGNRVQAVQTVQNVQIAHIMPHEQRN